MVRRIFLVALLLTIINISWAPPAPRDAEIDQLIQANATSMQELQQAVSHIEALVNRLTSSDIDAIIEAKLQSYAHQLGLITTRLKSKLPTESAGA